MIKAIREKSITGKAINNTKLDTDMIKMQTMYINIRRFKATGRMETMTFSWYPYSRS